jgi:hypothetical protein
MTKPNALLLRDKILRLCDAEKQWVVVSESRQPNLKIIKLEVSIKIDTQAKV